MQVEIYERDAFMTTQEKSKILCRLKYTKESFALNIQTNNITWDLWWYVVGILLPLGWSRKNENKSNENIQWHSTEWYGKNNEHINNDDDDDDDIGYIAWY